MNPLDWTNATKAAALAILNAGLGLAVSMGVHLSTEQMAAIMTFGNAIGGFVVLITKERSPQWAGVPAGSPSTMSAPPSSIDLTPPAPTA